MSPAHSDMAASATDSKMDAILRRVQGEFLEMPGLRLTEAQARRLWTMDAAMCSAVLERLIKAGFLFRTRDGSLMRVEYAQRVISLASSTGRSAA